jgi:hypothetical protein
MLRVERIDTREMICGVGSGGAFVWNYKVDPFAICPDLDIPYSDILSMPYRQAVNYAAEYLDKHRFMSSREYTTIEIHLDSCEVGNEVIV